MSACQSETEWVDRRALRNALTSTEAISDTGPAQCGGRLEVRLDKDAILKDVEQVVRDVLDNDNVELHRSTTAEDVPNWDSLAHVKIMMAIEKRFGIRFEVQELSELSNVGAVVDVIAERKG
jgi:acyl carrier protein